MTPNFDEFYNYILKESHNQFHRKSWVSPEGHITFLQGTEHHADAIERISKSEKDHLGAMQKGWQALSVARTNDGGIVWVINAAHIHPNNYQKRAIVNMAIENGLTEVSVPEPHFKKTILWEK